VLGSTQTLSSRGHDFRLIKFSDQGEIPWKRLSDDFRKNLTNIFYF